ncbi:MAG: DEAD/DEAH box helicase [Sandaracinaceae bacterium]|nr:DEAD/DEAH box helicase [Sandaracinaceae bacterium]
MTTGQAPQDSGEATEPGTANAPELPTFDVIPLTSEVRRAIDEMGWTNPTPVQIEAYPLAIAGRDIIVQSRTGTGKTGAFGLPLVDRLIDVDGGPQALILAPTRELALQSAREIGRIGANTGVRTTAVYGGAPMERQVRELAEGAQIISGTPGRVLDHLRRGTIKGDKLKVLVLDEADEMLSMGFAVELHAIMELLPQNHQTLLFSATVDGPVQRVAERHMTNPEFITLSGDAVGALGIEHFTFMVSGMGRTRDLVRIIEVEDPESAIIFCNTKVDTERVATELQHAGFNAEWLNGDMAQSDREKVMAATRKGDVRFLVCTDVAARGIDISHLTHVINFEMPNHLEQYVHRTGRTGRAGRTGTAITLVAPQELGQLYYLRLQYSIFPVERSIPTPGEERTRREADRILMLARTFQGTTQELDRAVAKRLLTHPDAEHLIAGLLGSFFGKVEESVDERATAARREQRPRPAPNPERERSTSKSARPQRAAAPSAPPAQSSALPDDEDDDLDNEGSSEGASGERRPRRRRKRRGESQGTEGEQAELTFDATATGAEAPSTESRRTDDSDDTADEDEAKLYVSLGRRDEIGASELNRLFVDVGGVPADQLGRIRVRDRHSFVFLPTELADDAIAKLNGTTQGDRELVVEFARK